MVQHVMPERLKQHRARIMIGSLGLGEVDPAVLQIGDRARRVRQVAHMVQGEPEVRCNVGDQVLRHRSGGVTHRVQDFLRFSLKGGEVVVLAAHLPPQLGVGPAGFLGGGNLFVEPPLQLALEPHQRFEDLHRQAR